MSELNPNFDINLKRIAFAFNYSEDNPIAIRDFTTSLNGLNELYSIISEGGILTDNGRIELGKPVYENRKSELYIERIEKGSILVALTDPNPWIEAIELVAAIITIIEFIKKFGNPNSPNHSEDSVIFKSVSFRKAINSLKRFMEIIKTPDEKIIMKDITGETEIDYHLKNAILDKCKLIKKMNIRNS